MLSWIWPTDDEDIQYVPIGGDTSKESIPLRSDDENVFVVHCLHVAFDKYVIMGSYESIRIDDIETGETLNEVISDFDWVYSLSMVYTTSPQIVSGHRDAKIRLWDFFDFTTLEPLQILYGHSKSIVCLDVLQGVNPLIVSSSLDCTVRVWLQATGELLHSIGDHSYPVRGLKVVQGDTNGRIISGDDSGIIHVYNLNYQLLIRIKGTKSAVHSFCVYQDDKSVLVIGRGNGIVAVRNLETGELIRSFRGHSGSVSSLAIWRDKEPVLITGSYDSTVCLWDLYTGEAICTIRSHTAEILTLSTTQLRRPKMITSGGDMSIKTWDLDAILREETMGTGADVESFL
jgi:WD40 repeat protein